MGETRPGRGPPAKLVLGPLFEADLEPTAYAYQAQRSANDAAKGARGGRTIEPASSLAFSGQSLGQSKHLDYQGERCGSRRQRLLPPFAGSVFIRLHTHTGIKRMLASNQGASSKNV
jgi:hypothetical protein